MNSILSKRGRYYCRIPRASVLSAVFLLSVFPARSQDDAPSQTKLLLPAGAGQKIMELDCNICHDVNAMVMGAQWDPKDWAGLVNRMVEFGAPLKKDEIPVVVDYLNTNFTGKGKPTGVVIPGSVEATIKEWDLPTHASQPHDPLYTRDGFLWYTGQFANLLGRFDPKTQQFKEFHLKHPHSGPHGLVEDKQGNIFFTAQQGWYIGKLDPKTGDVTEYPLPESGVQMHSIAITQEGMIFFTVLEARPPWQLDGSKIGRLNPQTGEIKLVNTPTPNSGPYGIVVNSKGIPFFTERGSPRLGSIDPETMKITEYVLPDPKIGTRRLAVTPDDVIWYTDSVQGHLGRFDPKTGKFKEWPSPSGPKSFPYGINTVGNIIWYAESNSNPNILVRFDPETEKFQSWPIQSGGGIKHISPQPDGNLWITRPGTNGIAYIELNDSQRGQPSEAPRSSR